MKKITAIVLLMAMVFSLAGCGNSVSIGAFSSKYFNGDDYDAAVQEVMTYFKGFEGCTMKKIGYAGDEAVKAEAESRGLAPEQVMVLVSTFSIRITVLTEADAFSRGDGKPSPFLGLSQ